MKYTIGTWFKGLELAPNTIFCTRKDNGEKVKIAEVSHPAYAPEDYEKALREQKQNTDLFVAAPDLLRVCIRHAFLNKDKQALQAVEKALGIEFGMSEGELTKLFLEVVEFEKFG